MKTSLYQRIYEYLRDMAEQNIEAFALLYDAVMKIEMGDNGVLSVQHPNSPIKNNFYGICEALGYISDTARLAFYNMGQELFEVQNKGRAEYWWPKFHGQRKVVFKTMKAVCQDIQEEGINIDNMTLMDGMIERLRDLLGEVDPRTRDIIAKKFPEVIDQAPVAFKGDFFLKSRTSHTIHYLWTDGEGTFTVTNLKHGTEWKTTQKCSGIATNLKGQLPFLNKYDFHRLCGKDAIPVSHDEAFNILRDNTE